MCNNFNVVVMQLSDAVQFGYLEDIGCSSVCSSEYANATVSRRSRLCPN